MVPLWPELANSATFGAIPNLRSADLDAALAALVAAGEATLIEDDRRSGYRLTEQLQGDADRAERRALRAAVGTAEAEA